ncbi:Protein roadkill-like protein [Dinothrombium tinctorium]|uniref:Protein roadkill-like protein n=1 Tax=Dinothrombium tinctorium TaxID=1965070 RepID=A0A3S3PY89_9ACAR|nr:Protein roadkill-like protein [Dinothrombium tinctorium]
MITDIKLYQFIHVWKIRNFRNILDLKLSASSAIPIKSSKAVFEIEVSDERYGEYIPIKFKMKSCENEQRRLRAMFDLTIEDNDGKNVAQSQCDKPNGRVFNVGDVSVCNDLLHVNTVLSDQVLGTEGTLKISFAFYIFKENDHSLQMYSKTDTKRSFTDDIFQFFKSNYKFDFEIVANDGNETKIHKLVLMARSSFFRAMLDHELKEKRENQIVIDDFNSDVIKHLIHYMYTDELSDFTYAEDLLLAADKYELPELKRICEQNLCGKIDKSNCGKLLILSDQANGSNLKNAVIDFVKENMRELWSNGSLRKQLNGYPHLVLDIIVSIQI